MTIGQIVDQELVKQNQSDLIDTIRLALNSLELLSDSVIKEELKIELQKGKTACLHAIMKYGNEV